MSLNSFEYDVAFSFHSKDESVATQLNDLIQDRFKTFLYSKRQEVLAGKDGEDAFSAVFGSKARIVVIFYRREWGQTPFTRIEETSIRNRAHDEGYDFTLFIPTETPTVMPPWLPKNRLYLALERFGLKGAAGVIEQRIQECGGAPQIETVVDRAARLERARHFQKLQKQFRESYDGVDAARNAFDQLSIALEKHARNLAGPPNNLPLQAKRAAEFRVLFGLGPVMLVFWNCHYSNSLSDAALNVEFLSHMPRLPGLVSFHKEPTKLKTMKFEYDLIASEQHAYVAKSGLDGDFSAESLADELLRAYMDQAEKYKRP